MNILERIKELRNAKGISQYDMADKLGIGQSTYFQIEKGKTELTVSRLYDIASVLNVSIAELLDIEVKSIDQSDKIKQLEKEVELWTLRTFNAEGWRSENYLMFQQIAEELFKIIKKEKGIDLYIMFQLVEQNKGFKGEEWFTEDIINDYRLIWLALVGQGQLYYFDDQMTKDIYDMLKPFSDSEKLIVRNYEVSLKSKENNR